MFLSIMMCSFVFLYLFSIAYPKTASLNMLVLSLNATGPLIMASTQCGTQLVNLQMIGIN